MAQTFAEHAVALAAISATVTKVGDETRTLLAAVATLTQAVADAQNVPAEVVAATDALAAQAQVVDDLVPDAPNGTPGSVINVG